METPRDKVGEVTEEIMKVFSFLNPGGPVIDLETAIYNRVYSHVLQTLYRAYGQFN